jgi:hypothetical protein
VSLAYAQREARPFLSTWLEQLLDIAGFNSTDLIGMPNSHLVVLRDIGRWKRVGWTTG